jgi:hypothetical protein
MTDQAEQIEEARTDLATLPIGDLRTIAEALSQRIGYSGRMKREWQERRQNAFKHNPSGEAQCAANADAWQDEEGRARRLYEVVKTLHNAEVRRLQGR